MNLDELGEEHFFERAVEFLNSPVGSIGFMTSLPSTFFSMAGSKRYPQYGIVLRGALMHRRIMI